MALGRRDFTRRSDRIEELVRRVENTADPAIRAVAQELLQAVIELHGVALERIIDAIAELPEGQTALAHIAEDELVSGVLSLHALHPVPVEERVAAAIEKTQPYIQSHGGDVELTSIEEDIVHVRLKGACGSCSSSAETLKGTVESAIYAAAPEIASVSAEAVSPAPHSDLVILQTT